MTAIKIFPRNETSLPAGHLKGLRVGIPRALLYHWYGAAWEAFLRALDEIPVVSPPTNKLLLALGRRRAPEELCLPVQLFLGHAFYLAEEVGCDLLFVPQLVSLEEEAFTCPKLMGLPDVVRSLLPGKKAIVLRVDARAGRSWWQAMREVTLLLGGDKRAFARARQAALAAQKKYEEGFRQSEKGGGPYLAVLGHPYCLYDRFLNMDLLFRLARAGYRTITPEMLPAAAVGQGLAGLAKPLFWSFGRRELGAANYLLGRGCRGVVHLSAFACGPDALVGELVEEAAVRSGIPLLRLVLDEHTGEAGFLTRLEAFLEMLGRRAR
ncbi:MAG: acyl-CoA dehydratase activase-related protein [Bacillota bacterium]